MIESEWFNGLLITPEAGLRTCYLCDIHAATSNCHFCLFCSPYLPTGRIFYILTSPAHWASTCWCLAHIHSSNAFRQSSITGDTVTLMWKCFLNTGWTHRCVINAARTKMTKMLLFWINVNRNFTRFTFILYSNIIKINNSHLNILISEFLKTA